MRYFKYRHTGLLQVPNDIDKALNMTYLKCYFFYGNVHVSLQMGKSEILTT